MESDKVSKKVSVKNVFSQGKREVLCSRNQTMKQLLVHHDRKSMQLMEREDRMSKQLIERQDRMLKQLMEHQEQMKAARNPTRATVLLQEKLALRQGSDIEAVSGTLGSDVEAVDGTAGLDVEAVEGTPGEEGGSHQPRATLIARLRESWEQHHGSDIEAVSGTPGSDVEVVDGTAGLDVEAVEGTPGEEGGSYQPRATLIARLRESWEQHHGFCRNREE